MTLLVGYIVIALGFSFLCSILEAVLLSITPSFMAHLEHERPNVGRTIRELKAQIDRPLAAILSLNTIAHTIGAAGAGAEAQRIWGSEVLAIASAILTLLLLVLSEIIPKTLGALYWRRLAPFVATLLPPMIRLLLPLVILSEWITRALKERRGKSVSVSREELAALARLGGDEGVFAPSESRVLQNLFRLRQLRVRDIMTPRTVVFALNEETTVAEVLDLEASKNFSRIPVYGRTDDDIRGYVLKDELLLQAARQRGDRQVGDLVRDLLVLPESQEVPSAFEMMLQKREHIALVVDEYGGVDGIVTMEDILETLLGLEIIDEADTVQDMREMARKKWQMRAKRLASQAPPSAPTFRPSMPEIPSGEPSTSEADEGGRRDRG